VRLVQSPARIESRFHYFSFGQAPCRTCPSSPNQIDKPLRDSSISVEDYDKILWKTLVSYPVAVFFPRHRVALWPHSKYLTRAGKGILRPAYHCMAQPFAIFFREASTDVAERPH